MVALQTTTGNYLKSPTTPIRRPPVTVLLLG
jgi:hypothetical protein